MESGNEFIDRWVCPNDRQLALRGKLDIGWSTFAENVYKRSYVAPITDDEQEKIMNILLHAKEIEQKEQERIGNLVEKVNNLKDTKRGDGETSCLVCGAKKGSLKPCIICLQGVCPKCLVESMESAGLKRVFCIICWEERELWKKSGAWFLKSMPAYVTPEERMARMQAEDYDFTDGRDQCNTLDPFMTAINRRPSYFEEEDSEETEEESEDEISSYFDQTQDAYHKPSTDFNLGIDCSEVSKEVPRSITPPEISFTPETPDALTQKSFANGFEHTDSVDSTDSLSPQMRPRKASNLSEGKKKLAMKFRKKSKDSRSRGTPSPRGDNDSVRSREEEDIDQIFKSYEKENGLGEEEEKQNSFGPRGILEFTLQYDVSTLELLVIVHCGKGLKAMDHGKSSDPYVKTHLLPGASKSTKKRTQTILKNLNPIFNESLIYHGITQKEISQKILRLSVMDENKLSSNAFIGETCVPLKALINRPVQRFKKILEDQTDELAYEEVVDIDDIPGRIELALHYLSKQKKLVVGIIRCVGLKAMDPNGYSDPYVKCYLLPDPKKKSKRKTAVKKKTLNPEFNEEFVYDISHNDLAKKTLCLTVWDHDVGTRNDFIGSLSLGIKASGEALKHWFETLKKSDRRVTRWHTLSFFMPSGLDEDD